MTLQLEITEGIQVAPRLIDLNFGGFQQVEVCEDCKMHIASDSINSFAPCSNCGGRFSGFKSFTGTYDKKHKAWLKRTNS